MKTMSRRYSRKKTMSKKRGKYMLTRKGNREYIRDRKGRIIASYRVTASGRMVKEDAERHFRMRKGISKRMDRRRNAKQTLSGTGYSLDKRRARARWFINPGSSDIKGVDTKRQTASRRLTKRRKAFGRTRRI